MTSIETLRDCAEGHLDAYTDPAGRSAFVTYDSWWDRSPDRITPAEVFMANCLSLRLTAPDVVPLFARGDTPATRLLAALQRVLDEVPAEGGESFEDLSSIDEAPFTYFRAACAATDATETEPKVRNWTAVTVSKVLHRLRPALVPVVDSEVSAFYGAGPNRPVLYRALHSDIDTNREWLADLAARRRTPDGRPLSLLRTADIVIWHHRTHSCPNSA
ncbi:DUF6308 family protein [Geodermatophilus sp. SYSU D00684]